MEVMNENTSLSAEDEERLDDFYRAMEKESSRFVGYPSNAVFDYSEVRSPLIGNTFLTPDG